MAKCKAITRKGKACKNKAIEGVYCGIHSKAKPGAKPKAPPRATPKAATPAATPEAPHEFGAPIPDEIHTFDRFYSEMPNKVPKDTLRKMAQFTHRIGDESEKPISAGGYGTVYKIKGKLLRERILEGLNHSVKGIVDKDWYAAKMFNRTSTVNQEIGCNAMARSCAQYKMYGICYIRLGGYWGWVSVMEFLNGTTLENLELNANAAKHVLSQLMQQVECLHANGVHHGDISPRNIMYDVQTNKVYLLDFGVCNDSRIAEGFARRQKRLYDPNKKDYILRQYDKMSAGNAVLESVVDEEELKKLAGEIPQPPQI